MRGRKTSSSIRAAAERGYAVDQFGAVISPRGLTLKLMVRTHNAMRYLCFSVGDRKVKVHRFVAFLKFGARALRRGVHVRHLNGDNMDNSWGNIKLGNQSQNERDKPAETHRRNGERLLASLLKAGACARAAAPRIEASLTTIYGDDQVLTRM